MPFNLVQYRVEAVYNLEIAEYDMSGADDTTNTKRVGVCIYYKKRLPLKVLNIAF